MASYEVWLRRDDGTALALLEKFTRLQYNLLTNDVSACQIDLPEGAFDKTFFTPDRRLEVWRQATGGAKVREGIWFIRKLKDWTDANGARTLEVTGYSPNFLLSSRIVAYPDDQTLYAQSGRTAPYDDMMKYVVSENLSTMATDASRALSTGYFGVNPMLSQASTGTYNYAWRNVLNVLQDISEASRGAGTELYFSLVPFSDSYFEFCTQLSQPGIDHTYPDGNPPVLLGVEYGNLAEPELEQDWSEEVTFLYAAGQGEGDARTRNSTSADDRWNRSIFGRREAFYDARHVPTTSGLDIAMRQELAQGRPKSRFSAKIIDSAGCRYGIHWRHGDRVSAIYGGQQYDCIVRTVQVWVAQDGEETLVTRMESAGDTW